MGVAMEVQGFLSVLTIISLATGCQGSSTYYVINDGYCSSITTFLDDDGGYIYGAKSDYTSTITTSCTRSFAAEDFSSTITVTVTDPDYCPDANDILEIYDGSSDFDKPIFTFTRTSTLFTFTTTTNYLTLKLTSSKYCTSRSYRGFRLSYTINSDDYLSVGGIAGIVIALIVVITVASVGGCICCGVACFNKRARTQGTIVQAAAYPTAQDGHSAPYPSHSVPYTSQPAPYPSQPAPYPSQPAPYPSQPAPYPSQPAPYPSGAAPYPSGPAPYPSGPAPYPTSYPIQTAPTSEPDVQACVNPAFNPSHNNTENSSPPPPYPGEAVKSQN